MSAFPGFKGFGSNTNPQGMAQGGGASGLAAYKAKLAGKKAPPMGFQQKAPSPMSGSSQPQTMPSPPGFGVDPLKGLSQLGKRVHGAVAPFSGVIKGTDNSPWASPWDKDRQVIGRPQGPSMRDEVGAAMLSDMGLQQKANDFNWGRAEAGRGAFLANNDEAVGRMRKVGGDAADAMDRAGQDAYEASVGAADDNFDRILKRVQETEANHKDRTAQDIAAINHGIMSQRASEMSRQIDEMGLGGADPNDPQVAQIKAEFQAETSRMRQQAATQLVSRDNEFRSQFEQGNTQILAGVGSDSAQIKAQAAQAFGAYRAQTEQFRVAVEGAALDRKLQGDLAGYEMLVQNPHSPMGYSAVLASIMEMFESGAGRYESPMPRITGYA